MKKLEDIERKVIFKVPDGYFESLPTIIQSRIARKKPVWNSTLVLGLKYALPIVAVTIGLFWFLNSEPEASPEELIASVSSQDIAEYLTTMEIAPEDFLESLDYTQINADSLDLYESDIPIEDADLTDILFELDVESLNDGHE